MKSLIKYSNLKKIFIVLALIIICVNFISLMKICRTALAQNKSQKPIEPGYEFADLKEKIFLLRRIGFLTNKDMSPERNDGQFLAAQYVLAPVVLDLDNPNYQFLILDYTGLVPAFDKMEAIGADPIYINDYSKVLAKIR